MRRRRTTGRGISKAARTWSWAEFGSTQPTHARALVVTITSFRGEAAGQSLFMSALRKRNKRGR